jgi:hypothetical protein
MEKNEAYQARLREIIERMRMAHDTSEQDDFTKWREYVMYHRYHREIRIERQKFTTRKLGLI